MKLRLEPNSVRYRIRKSELQTLSDSGFITAVIEIAENMALSYSLKIDEKATTVSCTFINHDVCIHIPEAEAREWINTNLVGLYYDVPLAAKDKLLQILIEKDFPCIDRPWEDRSDTFEELVEKKDVC